MMKNDKKKEITKIQGIYVKIKLARYEFLSLVKLQTTCNALKIDILPV